MAAKKVYTVERIEDLYLKAKTRLAKAGYSNIDFKLGDGRLGWEENAPYDRIMVTAAASNMPEKLLDQLALGGKMIVPVESDQAQDLMVIEKDLDGKINEEIVAKVRFVKLIGEY